MKKNRNSTILSAIFTVPIDELFDSEDCAPRWKIDSYNLVYSNQHLDQYIEQYCGLKMLLPPERHCCPRATL